MTSALQVVSATPDHAFGILGNVVLYNWRRETTPEGALALMAMTARARASNTCRLLALGFAEPQAHMPSAEIRAQMARTMRDDWGPAVAASTMVFSGDGFRASAVRAIATGMSLIARQPFPHQTYKSLEEAVAWLCHEARERKTPCPDAKKLVAAMTELRAA